MALASITDFEDITGTSVASGDVPRIERLLDLATDAMLAGAHGQTIVAATSVDVLRPYEGVIYLPQRPVTAVSSVVVDGAMLDPGSYRFTTGGDRRPARLIYRSNSTDYPWDCNIEATVTYDHGWATVPGQIIAATVVMAQAVVATGGGPAVSQTSTGPFSETLATFDIQSSTMNLSGPTRSLLDQLCGVDGFASVPVGRDLHAR